MVEHAATRVLRGRDGARDLAFCEPNEELLFGKYFLRNVGGTLQGQNGGHKRKILTSQSNRISSWREKIDLRLLRKGKHAGHVGLMTLAN